MNRYLPILLLLLLLLACTDKRVPRPGPDSTVDTLVADSSKTPLDSLLDSLPPVLGVDTLVDTTTSIDTVTTVDSTVVVIVQPPADSAPAARRAAIPFGPFGYFNGPNVRTFTLAHTSVTPATIVDRIEAARARHVKLSLAMTGGAHANYKTDSVFDMAKWRAAQAAYDTPAIKEAVAKGVADGTIAFAPIMDEPHNHVTGTERENSWGPAGTMTKIRVDSMCGYTKSLFPSLPVGPTHPAVVFQPAKSYRVCDFFADQFANRKGDVIAYRDSALAIARKGNHQIVFSLNVLDGGEKIPGCPQSSPGTVGTNCGMTPDQIRRWGTVLGRAGCALLLWRYDAAFMGKPSNQAAFKDLADSLSARPARSCSRR